MKLIEWMAAIAAIAPLAASTAMAAQRTTELHQAQAGDGPTCVMSKSVAKQFEEYRKKIDAMQTEQSRLLLELRRQIADMQKSQLQDDLSRRLSEIEQRIFSEGDTQPMPLACPLQAAASKKYAREVINRISECGTRNYPTKDGERLYGSGALSFVLDRHGNIVKSSIEDSSHNEFLDAAILRLAQSSAPFGPVPAALHAGKFRQFLFVMQFRFERDAESNPPNPEKRCIHPPASPENAEAGV